MSYHLVVRTKFGAYKAGALISDPADVDTVLAGRNSRNVVKVFAENTHVGNVARKTVAAAPVAASPEK